MSSLSARELQCLKQAATGQTAHQIADFLGISERTVRFHLGNAYRKLGAQCRAQAIAIAMRKNLVS